ncbi:DUF1344 domain-containing protein [Allorhizobium taibaishanense]|uniref:DUF1344 domain-containing protein n=1 Tax=Allorhizobium taibaishanense TaxID=887144 RepID=A0A1Q9AAE3_9HYPH|nr:DUF1344 domain-containing protein [Allorhizobium taibaishanense]MBB4007033.1 hypothetical protein [Allorhizobium taibaishanense]OLP51844.1 hypothetical protein BJF91_23205 [Allorhizobium taibaishanense]
MGFLIAMLMTAISLFAPINAFAQSDDVESTIKAVSTEKLTVTLDDGKTYSVPAEFNFDGLTPGVKVVVYYTVVDGKRVVDDLQVVN